jgi:hypothetical protein
MVTFTVIVTPPETQGEPQYLLTVNRAIRQAGFGSMKAFSNLSELLEALRWFRILEREIADVEAAMKARVTHVLTAVSLKSEDFQRVGMQMPE